MEQKKKNWDQLKRWKTQKDTLKSKEENLHPTSVVRKIKTLANKISVNKKLFYSWYHSVPHGKILRDLEEDLVFL